MHIISCLEEIESLRPTAVAIGKFDGVHAGHKRLLSEIVSAAADGLIPCVFTFEPSPERFFLGDELKLLSTREERREILKDLGVALLIEYPLDKNSAAVKPERFVEEYLCRRLKARLVAAGTDLSFGAGGAGDLALLKAMRRGGGYETVEVQKLKYNGSVISSSRVRALVKRGEMEEAVACLGRAYSISGVVRHGEARGRTIGFPTMNIAPAEEKLMPPKGVYVSRVSIGGECFSALTDIGNKPTVEDNAALGVESYLFDYAQDAYGMDIRVELLKFLRPERRFDSMEELAAQIEIDKKNSLAYTPRL